MKLFRRFLRKNQPSAAKKKIVLIGGLGTIGSILEKGFSDIYEMAVLDICKPTRKNRRNYVKVDVANMDQLMTAIPDDAYALVNITGLPNSVQPPIPDAKGFHLCNDVYVVGTYNVLMAAAKKGIRKVVIASTNHVTGAYEVGGISTLGREIRTDDYPLPDSIYGAMKLCGELFCYLFSREKNISVICLRMGSVVEDELSVLRSNDRAHRTIMSKRDTVEIFKKAIEAEIEYGVYYGVSDNTGKPWDISNTIDELKFQPKINAQALLDEENYLGEKNV
jgi:NAD+ dependent glucose-6-phosphate dehydrogenase